MGLITTLITIATAAVATKKVGENLIDKKSNARKIENKEFMNSKRKEIKEKSKSNLKIKKIEHENEIKKMTHQARLEKSQFDKDGNMVYTKKCPNCGKNDSIDAMFCSYCGAEMNEIKIKCPSCQRLVSKSSKFCNFCGKKLKEENI